jgi:hypothetical protein
MFTSNFINVTSHMAQDPQTAVLTRTPLTADVRVRSQVSPCNVPSGHSGTVTGLFFEHFQFCRQYHSNNSPQAFSATRCSYQNNQHAKPERLPKSNVPSEIGDHWTEKYVHMCSQFPVLPVCRSQCLTL